MRRWALPLFMAVTGCAAANSSDAPAQAEKASPVEADRFEGRIVAANSTDIQSPPTSYVLNGHFYNHSWSKIEHLSKDGATVKKDDVLARFRFWGKDQLPRIQSNIKKRRAESERTAVGLDSTLGKLLTQQKKSILRTEAARLDTLKAGSVSARKLRIYELVHTMARFEGRAIKARIAAHRDAITAQEVRDRLRVENADEQLSLFEVYQKRFEIKAPHDGVIRHQRHPWHRRKVRKGDGLPSGSPVISLSQDTILAVEVFIPESLAAEVKVGAALEVFSVADDRSWPVQLTEVRLFPQRLGFLYKDEDHARALERAYVGVAPLPENVDGLSAGNEVQVRLVREAAR